MVGEATDLYIVVTVFALLSVLHLFGCSLLPMKEWKAIYRRPKRNTKQLNSMSNGSRRTSLRPIVHCDFPQHFLHTWAQSHVTQTQDLGAGRLRSMLNDSNICVHTYGLTSFLTIYAAIVKNATVVQSLILTETSLLGWETVGGTFNQ